jgi:putative tryptophan/tyrosine transport system ATP-binding protein
MIKIESLNKTFNKGTINEVYALKNINLHISEGDFVTIIGTNGSGKSTLLNAIAGSFMPDTGKILVNNEEFTKKPEYKRAKYISRVFQNPYSGTAPNMTIAENLLIAYNRSKKIYPKIGLKGNLYKFFKEEITQLEMQLEDRLDNIIGTLSGGQRQAITLLMSTIVKPKVLLLDEHTAALDPKTASQVIKLTNRFVQADNLTTIMITHSMQQALELGNKTVMMYKGEIIDSLNANEKKKLTVNDLLNKFADLRKKEKVTDDLIGDLRKEYM